MSAVVQGRGDGVRGHRGRFTKVAAGMVFRGFVPMKASGRENSISFSCMSSAKAAAALAGAPACLTPRLRPGRPIRATPFLPQHARRPPIFLRWHEHLQLFINSFERHALSRRGFPCLARLYPTLADLLCLLISENCWTTLRRLFRATFVREERWLASPNFETSMSTDDSLSCSTLQF